MRTTHRSALLLTFAAVAGAQPALAQAGGTPGLTPMPGRDGRIARACGSTNDNSVNFRRSVGDSARMNVTTTQPPAGTTPVTGGTARSHDYPEYDVVLEVPNLCVQNIHLKVDTVTAKIDLDAKISNLVHIAAGADVFIGDVDLTIRGVRAQALLLVDLDNVYHIVDNTLTFVDNHPEIIKQLGSTLQNTGGAVGGLVGEVVGGVTGLLLNTTRNASGQVVQRLDENATGRIVEKTLSSAGQAIAQRAVGSVLDLPTLSETAGAAGTVVRRVRDQAGKVIEFTLNKATNAVSNVKLP
jgi:hypothetical protein